MLAQQMKTMASYEKAASLVITLLILIGSAALLLFGIWLTTSFLKGQPEPVAVQLFDGEGTGVNDDAEFDPDVTTPGNEFETEEMTLQQALQIVDTLSANASMFADPAQVDENILLPGGTKGDGRTKGDGDGRGKRHWEFVFQTGITAAEYARQLDFFGIELGVLLPGGKVAYASKLSARKPEVKYGASETEKRFYLTWLKGDLQAVEREILAKAGIEHEGKLILKFLPQPLEMKLAEMEAVQAGSQRDKLRATHFGIRAKPNSKAGEYEFFVMNQVIH